MVSDGGSIVKATVSGGSVQASVVQSGGVAATVGGGQGPAGPAGPPGASSLSGLSDVMIQSAAAGDVLRYNGSKWTDYPDVSLTDGGSF